MENLAGERIVAGFSGTGSVKCATPRTFWMRLRRRVTTDAVIPAERKGRIARTDGASKLDR